VGGKRSPAAAEFWVRDNGRGLSPERLPRLFEPFASVFSEDSEDAGPGLGLFLVRQLVAGWGGAIRVRSESGRGTTFTLLVPDAALNSCRLADS